MLEVLKNLVWSPVAAVSIMLLGVVFLIKTHFIALIGLPRILIKKLTHASKSKKAFGLMCTSLGGTIGVGNAIGVAGAICEGGAGAVFWMAVAGILGMAIKYVEVYLALRDGGAIKYIESESGTRAVAVIFSFLCILVSLGMGNAAQVSAAINTVDDGSSAARIIVAAVMSIAFLSVINGGIDKIRKFSAIAVPIVSLTYTVALAIIFFVRREHLANVFDSILSGSGIISGFKWSLIKTGVTCGFSKAIFSSEAGLGSAGFAHGESEEAPLDQAEWAIVEVLIDTLICLMTALAVLTCSNEISSLGASNMTKGIFTLCFGESGRLFYGISTIIFAFSSIICWYFNGSTALAYLCPRSTVRNLYLAVFVFLILASAFAGDSIVIELSDIANGLMLTVNLCTLWTAVLKKKLTF